jgi:pimeloyl-ACP methyl ester carboxylesterase
MPPPGVTCALVLPGSGSDEVFVRNAFGPALDEAGIALVAPPPRPGRGVVAGYRAALDAALGRSGPLLVGGVSLGAHVAARWAATAPPGRIGGLLLALPAWTGTPGEAPAARAALASAADVRSGGVDTALAPARTGAPPWIAAELGRAWPRYGAGLAASLEAAAAEPAPTADELATLAVPAGIAAAVDDPVHPEAVARRWAAALPQACVATLRLAEIGADPAMLGRAVVGAWRAAVSAPGGRGGP